MNKKRAFTMVELIFVIVILGILAAVAVPKLNASREDAQAATILADIRTLANDIHTYYAAKGEIAAWSDLRPATNVALVPTSSSNKYFDYKVGDEVCIEISADCADGVIFWYNKAASSACGEAVKKAEFLRGEDVYDTARHASGMRCSKDLAPKIKTLENATESGGWTGVLVFYGTSAINFD